MERHIIDFYQYRNKYVCVQEVCHQYWPTSGVLHVEEFTVELLGEERLTGFIIRSFSLLHRKVGSLKKELYATNISLLLTHSFF